jgi:hypothetical protein
MSISSAVLSLPLIHSFCLLTLSLTQNLWRKLDVRLSVHHSTILTEKPKQDATMYQNLLFLILNEAQHVSGNTPPIIRSTKLHKRPLALHNTVEGCWTSNNCTSDNLPQYYAKPEAACAVLGS